MPSRVRKAVLPVAGLGTRMLPATKAVPKEMMTVVDRPLIHYVVDEARAAGIEQLIFVTGRGKTAIEDHFDSRPDLEDLFRAKGKDGALESVTSMMWEAGAISFIRQQSPLGLGHAVWCARHAIGDEPFAVLLPDELILGDQPCLRQLIDVHEARGGNVAAICEVPDADVSRYGVLDVAEREVGAVRAKGLVEKPAAGAAPSNFAIVGRYVLEPSVMRQLARTDPGAGGEIQLTDAMTATLPETAFRGVLFDGRRIDCGRPEGMLEANIAAGLWRADTRAWTIGMLTAESGALRAAG